MSVVSFDYVPFSSSSSVTLLLKYNPMAR